MLENSRVFCKVRPSPIAAIASLGNPAASRPRNRTTPELGG